MVKEDYTDPSVMVAADQLAKDIKDKLKKSADSAGK